MDKFSGDLLLGEGASFSLSPPGKGAFRMTAQLGALHYRVSLQSQKETSPGIDRARELTPPINHQFTFFSNLQRNYKNVTLNLSLKSIKRLIFEEPQSQM